MSRRDALGELVAVYAEVEAEALARETEQASRRLFERVLDSKVACVAESLGPQTQRVTGIPWVLPSGRLSDKGRLLDRDLLSHFGYTADPHNMARTYAYLTDVSHLWLGRGPNNKLRRPSTQDKNHCAPWLQRELQAVRPRVVILLGRHAAPFFLERYGGIRVGRLREVIAWPYVCKVGDFETTAVPTLHPTGAQMAPGGSGSAYAETARLVTELLAGASSQAQHGQRVAHSTCGA
jgi:uracil-DNA glycosylase family 4